MTVSNEFAAALIEQGARGLASIAVAELAAQSEEPEIAADPGWRDWFLARITDLAAAIETGIPRLFAIQAEWATGLFSARDVPDSIGRQGITILHRTVRDELPDHLGDLVDACFTKVNDERKSEAPANGDNEMCADYVSAILDGDQPRAVSIVGAASPADVEARYREVLVPAMNRIGDLWESGEISVAEEHFATVTTRMAMAELRGIAEKSAANGKTVVLAAVSGNLHDLALQMLADILTFAGWRTICLGADMPIGDLVAAVESYKADAVFLSASMLPQLKVARDTIAAIKSSQTGETIRVFVGGRAFAMAPELADSFGADGYSAGIDDAVAKATAAIDI